MMMGMEMEVVGEAGPQKYKAGQLWQLPKVIILPPASPPPGGVKPKVTLCRSADTAKHTDSSHPW